MQKPRVAPEKRPSVINATLSPGTLTIESGSGRQHFTHAGSTARAFIADDNDVAFLVIAIAHGLETLFLGIETACRTRKHLAFHASDFHNRALGSKIALQAHDASRPSDRFIGRTHNILLRVPLHMGHVFGNCATSHGHAISVQISVIEQRFHQKRNTAGLEHVLGDIATAGLQIRNVRSLLEDFGDVEQVKVNATLMSDRGKVQCRICRPAPTRKPPLPHSPGLHGLRYPAA